MHRRSLLFMLVLWVDIFAGMYCLQEVLCVKGGVLACGFTSMSFYAAVVSIDMTANRPCGICGMV
jgi:hypothetical protein